MIQARRIHLRNSSIAIIAMVKGMMKIPTASGSAVVPNGALPLGV
jgi:hypothetical protein